LDDIKDFLEQDSYFSVNEYLLVDSSFKPSNRIVSFLKKPAGNRLRASESYFNTKLSKIQINSQWSAKGKISSFEKDLCLIKDGTSLHYVNRLIVALAVLHNLVLLEDDHIEFNLDFHPEKE